MPTSVLDLRSSKRGSRTPLRVSGLTADCFIGEPADKNGPSQGHLLSVFGSDVEVAAFGPRFSATSGSEWADRIDPADRSVWRTAQRVSRNLTVPGRRRPIRHLVVASTQLRAEGDQARIIVKGNSPELILRAAVNFHGLPLLPSWGEWFVARSKGRPDATAVWA